LLEAGLSKDYYLRKIAHIEQDLIEIEAGIKTLYRSKSALINDWACALEAIGEQATDTICSTIVNRLIELDLTSGVAYVYETLHPRFKNSERSELTKAGQGYYLSHNVGNPRLYKGPPYEGLDPRHASPDKVQKMEEYYREIAREDRRRHTEYVQIMLQRGIPIVSDDDLEREPISTPKPYNPKQGHLWQATQECAIILAKLTDGYRQMAANIEDYPPRADGHEREVDCACQLCEQEDLNLATGMKTWSFYYSALHEYLRPLADKKFAQSHTHWQRTEIMNASHGKHAAAVLSKKDTYMGKVRALTREQVGDKQYDIYEKSIRYAASLELTNYLTITLPDRWRERIMSINVADRRADVGPILSEGAFGSDKKKSGLRTKF